jgi:putative CocE/NonD family hydrolase
MTPCVQTGQRVPVDDRVTLATDVYRPPESGRVPVVLIRTPYGRMNQVDEALGWVRWGFGCVVQDVRGRWESGGEWEPYAHERQDGSATLRWLTAQPWCGQIAVCGASYAAFTAWSAAVAETPVADVTGAATGRVGAVISLVPAMGTRRVRFAQDGILRLADHVGWWVTYGETATHRGELAARMIEQDPSMLRHLPVADMATRFWVP